MWFPQGDAAAQAACADAFRRAGGTGSHRQVPAAAAGTSAGAAGKLHILAAQHTGPVSMIGPAPLEDVSGGALYDALRY